MNRKHSFAVRCLALVLALVMILSNANLGLTMRAQAAEKTSSLIELITAPGSGLGTQKLNAILAYADGALCRLHDNEVTYEAEPEKANATLINGILVVEEVNGWVPYTYTVGDETKAFDGVYTVNVGADTKVASVTYKLNLGAQLVEDVMTVNERVEFILGYAAWMADEAAQQVKALDDISVGKALAGLQVLDLAFTEMMIEAVDALTLEDVGIDVDLSGDLNEDGVIDEIDAALAEEAKKELNTELENVKAEYKKIILAMQDRMVTAGGKYGDQKKYLNKLTIYAMLKEYNAQGLVHYYQNGAAFIAEMKELGNTLYDILGEKDSNGKYANEDVIKALLVEMDYTEDTLSVDDLAKMAGRMVNGAATLEELVGYQTQIDMTSENLTALVNALVDCGKVSTGYKTELTLTSKNLNVTDDTWRYINVVVGETEMPFPVVNKAEVTAEVAAEIIAKVEAAFKHYNVDTSAITALVGETVTENVTVNCTAVVKEYVQNIYDINGNVVDTIDIPGDATTFNLPAAPEGHTVSYMVYGNLYHVSYTDKEPIVIEIMDMDVIAAGELWIDFVEDVDEYKGGVEDLAGTINNAIGRDAVSMTTDENGKYNAMDITIALSELKDLAQGFAQGGITEMYLNGKLFISDDNGTPLINVGALISAILEDETFSSQKLIAMGLGGNARMVPSNNLLNATITVPGYEMAFTLNLTSLPAEMVTVAKGLKAIEDYFWFESKNGNLNISLNLPEKIYEVYLTEALATGKISDNNTAALNNEIGMRFVEDYLTQLMSLDVDANTFTNTLASVGVNKDLSAFHPYYDMVKKVVNSNGFAYTINSDSVNFNISGDKDDIAQLLKLLGLSSSELTLGMSFVSYDTITVNADVNIVNEVPAFQALVIEPGKINDAGIKNKLNTIDYTTNLAAKAPTTGNTVAVMLLADVNGNLNFPGNVIIDLNGKTIKGSINVGGKVVIVDSNLATYQGGTVEGDVIAKGGAILGGTFTTANVSKFLRDGYFQDNGSVRNAMFYVEGSNGNYNIVLNADFYQLCDGYLPSVEAVAAEIATEVALNAYPAAGMSYNGKSLYAINLDSVLNSYLGNGKSGAIDALLSDLTAFVNADGINALANDIIDDLCDFKALSAALEAGECVGGRYTINTYPATVKLVHVKETNTLDLSVVAASQGGKSFSIGLKVEGSNDYYDYAKELLAAMADMVSVDADVTLNQPTYNGASNTVSVSGTADASVVLDLSKNVNYTKAMAIILAYGNPDHAEKLMNAKNCVVDLNKLISEMTVEEVFTALKVMNRSVSMTEMAEKVGYKYDASEIADLEEFYHVILCGMGKVLEVLDITGHDAKLGTMADGEGTFTIDAKNRSVDASVKGFTGVAKVDFAEFTLTIKLATKCDKLIGDVDYSGEIDASDAALILAYDALMPGVDMHWCIADVDGSNEVDASDAAWILKYDALLCRYESFPAVNSNRYKEN